MNEGRKETKVKAGLNSCSPSTHPSPCQIARMLAFIVTVTINSTIFMLLYEKLYRFHGKPAWGCGCKSYYVGVWRWVHAKKGEATWE